MNPLKLRTVRRTVLTLALGVVSIAGLPAMAQAASPAWGITSTATPTNLKPGDSSGLSAFVVVATNIGGAPTTGDITLTDTLPAGLTLNPSPPGGVLTLSVANDNGQNSVACPPATPVTCTVTGGSVQPGGRLIMFVPVNVDPGAPPSLTNSVSVSGGGASSVSGTEDATVSAADAPYSFQRLDSSFTDADGQAVTQAGSHPYRFHTGFQLSTRFQTTQPINPPVALTKDIVAKLPVGMVVNPSATSVRCTEAQFENTQGTGQPHCPAESAVGVVHPTTGLFGFSNPAIIEPLFNMVPPPGVPAQLAFNVPSAGFDLLVHLNGGVDPAGNYALTAEVNDLIQYGAVSGVGIDLWGDPTDPSHDRRRARCAADGEVILSCPVPRVDTPFLTMPSACSGPLTTEIKVDSYDDPGNFITGSSQTKDPAGNPVGVTGCDALDFDPSIDLQPTTAEADSSSGLDVNLSLPQPQSQSSLAEATLKKAVVTLPEGMALNPSAADGLAGCDESQIGLASESPIRFDATDPSCPDGSKIGSAEITTPLLDQPIEGALYLADPDDNPFHSLLAGYIVAQGQGVTLKLAGRFDRDPQTGQITATFDNNPQLPFSDLNLHFKGGDRGVLVTPPECGTYDIDSALVPWSAPDPNNPAPSDVAHRTSSFDVTTGPNGGPCPDYTDPAKFTPNFTAGTLSPQAGGSSPFVLKITKPDGQQSLKQIHIDMPPGLVAKLAGVPKCPQAQITPGIDGSTNCPAASQIGTVNVGAGAGSTPFFLTQQPVYLTEGYAGAPYGIAIDTHALAGPFDLGHVVVRSTLNVDQDDAQVHIDSDQLPSIIQGIPLHIRDIRVKVDKLGFILNPTNCNPQTITGTVTGGGEDFAAPGDDTVKQVSDHFQVGGCGSLGFSPSLGLGLKGGMKRNGHPALTTVLRGKDGDANVGKVSVTLPPSVQLDQSHIQAPCTRPQFAARQCPEAAIIGTAVANSPLLDYQLTGPVYLRTGDNPLPDVVLDLQGPPTDPIEIVQVGKIDTFHARLRTSFHTIPDAPISTATISLVGGSKGLLVNNTDLCARTNVAGVRFDAQNGDWLTAHPTVGLSCPKARKRHPKHHKHHKHHKRHHQRHGAVR